MNRFNFIKVMVSPIRRAIETAINLLQTHPNLNNGGIKLILNPYLREQIMNESTLIFQQLKDMCHKLEQDVPGFTFDFTLMEGFQYPNFWSIYMLEDT